MLLQYQRFQLGGRIEEIEIDTNPITGRQYILLRDVQDVFPTAARFEKDGRPVRFLSDEQGNRIEPLRIACYPEAILQIVPVKQAPLQAVPTNTRCTSTSHDHSQISKSPEVPSILLFSSTSPSEEDWRECFFQRMVRVAILAVVLALTVLMNHGISSLIWHGNSYSMAGFYWRVVSLVLFILSVVWLLMLVWLVVQIVWFLINIPIIKKTTYQRLFDF